MKKRVSQYMIATRLPGCATASGCAASRCRSRSPASTSPTSRGCRSKRLAALLQPYADGTRVGSASSQPIIRRRRSSSQRIAEDLVARLAVLLDLGLGYLSLDRSTPTLSPGELQRLRLATQVRSNLFGVVYVLDEPSAGLHPADTEALLARARPLEGGGQLAVRRRARARRRSATPTGSSTSARRRRARRARALQRPARRARSRSRRRRRAAICSATYAPADAGAAHADGLAAPDRRHAQQPRRARRRLSARGVHDA